MRIAVLSAKIYKFFAALLLYLQYGGDVLEAVVYVDVLFMTNFICDFFLLYLTRAIYKSRSPAWRLALGAMVGSAYAVAIFFPSLTLLAGALASLAASCVIVAVSFKIRTLRDFLSLLFLFYLSGFVLAGISFALLFCTDLGAKTGAAMSNGVFYVNINPLLVPVGAAACMAVLFLGERIYMKRLLRRTNMHRMKIIYKQKSISAYALLDTANYATDPITNTPVVVCEAEVVLPLFENEGFYDDLRRAGCGIDALGLICDTPFRFVPYKPLGACEAVMLAFKPDMLEIDGRECECEVLVGLCEEAVCKNADYGALLHPRIMQRLSEESEAVRT